MSPSPATADTSPLVFAASTHRIGNDQWFGIIRHGQHERVADAAAGAEPCPRSDPGRHQLVRM